MSSNNQKVSQEYKHNSLLSKDKVHSINQLKFFIKSLKYQKQKLRILMKELNSEYKKIVEHLNNCIKILKTEIHTTTKETPVLIPHSIATQSSRPIFNLKDFNLFLKQIEIYSKFNSKFFIFENCKIILKESETEKSSYEDFLYFFHEKSTILKKFNLAKKKFENDSVIKMKTKTLIFPCIQQISPKEIFIHGGRTIENDYLLETIILDVETSDLEVISKGIPVSNSKPCLFGKSVYIFGGFKFSAISNSQKYDLIKNSWEIICELPMVMFESTSIAVSGHLLISGASSSKLFIYNPSDNAYDAINLNFTTGIRVVLFTYKNSIYLIANEVFRCSRLFLGPWEKVGISKDTSKRNLITSAVVRDNLVYFADWKGIVYEFNCLDATFKQFR